MLKENYQTKTEKNSFVIIFLQEMQKNGAGFFVKRRWKKKSINKRKSRSQNYFKRCHALLSRKRRCEQEELKKISFK